MSSRANVKRAEWIVGIFGLLLLLNAPAAAQLNKLRVSTIPVTDNAAFEVARAKGFFADEGLDVDTTPITGGAFGIPALAAGQIQIASSNIVSTILGAAHGLDLVMVCGGDTTGDAPPDTAALVVNAGTVIKSGKELEGKKVAVNARNNILWLYAREWIARTGGDPAKVGFVEVPFPQMLDAVRGGRVDAAMVAEPFLSAGVKSHQVDVAAWPFSTTQKRIPVAQFVATKSYADAHPDDIARFVRGYNRGVDWANNNLNSAEYLAIVSNYSKVAPDRLKESTSPIFTKTIDPGALDEVVTLMRGNGLLTGAFDSQAIIHKLVRAGAAP